MATEKKTPLHQHSHNAYAWIALVISVFAILGIAGWYYLTILDGYNDNLVYSVSELAIPAKQTTGASTTDKVSVLDETSTIDQEVNNVPESDLSDTQLDNTILGIN